MLTPYLCRDAAAGDLQYSCDELSGMAARFLELKQKGYSLNEVLIVIQENTESNPEKEMLLSRLAIEIYVDSGVNNEYSARRISASQCSNRQ